MQIPFEVRDGEPVYMKRISGCLLSSSRSPVFTLSPPRGWKICYFFSFSPFLLCQASSYYELGGSAGNKEVRIGYVTCIMQCLYLLRDIPAERQLNLHVIMRVAIACSEMAALLVVVSMHCVHRTAVLWRLLFTGMALFIAVLVGLDILLSHLYVGQYSLRPMIHIKLIIGTSGPFTGLVTCWPRWILHVR
nr:hypothetical protein CFP56_56557 [Quercus suber]